MPVVRLMESNVYSFQGTVLIAGSCLQQVFPEAFAELARQADMTAELCLEAHHLNMAVTKIAAILGTGQVERLLLDPDQQIGAVANLCGWKSSTHLMRAFRARYGMTMSEWRSRAAK